MYASHTLVSLSIVSVTVVPSSQRQHCCGGYSGDGYITLLVLAVVEAVCSEETRGLFWLWLVVNDFLGALIMYSFPRIGRWFFRRYDDNVIQFIFKACHGFLGSRLNGVCGNGRHLGAFLAGLVLNRPDTACLSVDESFGVCR